MLRLRSPFPLYVALVIATAAVIAAGSAWQLRDAVAEPRFWLMAGLAVLADARTFVTPGRRGISVVVSPSLCFTFAILLCWDLGPAIAAQVAASSVVAWRMRYPLWRAALAAAHYTLAFAAAYVVLVIGEPDPFGVVTPTDAVRDVSAVVGAVAAFLMVFGALFVVSARLRVGRSWWSGVRDSLGHRALFTSAMLLISPVFAVAAHVSAAFVPLVFVPLYAVERMARLSVERDRVARLDPLTGLANRGGLQASFDEMRGSMAVRTQPPRHVALMLLDLDRFKHVNDALGHHVGDRLLIAVAERLRATVPPGAVVARLGGDEFAIIAGDGLGRGTDTAVALKVAERVIAALDGPVELDGLQVDVAGSIGIAVYPDDGDDFATLMRHADVAMYDAKQRGDAIAFYSPESDHNSPERLALLTDFRRALEAQDRDQVVLHYQPQVSLCTGEVVGVEALLRWRHPTRGPVNPEYLLRVAEQTPVMQLLTTRVIDDVVAQVAEWDRQGVRLRASLNVSIRDLHTEEIVQRLGRRIAQHGVQPEQIQLEITEGALMADPGRVLATIGRISALGVAVSLDDFGTGYSSLLHLRRLPLTEVKVDRSFVAGMAHNSDDAAIVRSTVELARALGLRVVAEGVENEYTYRLLKETGCSVAQGWYSARPMPAEEIPGWLSRHRATVAAPAAPGVRAVPAESQ